ncbi:MAG: ricin-type beta-trefoil lectin domain protein [Rhodospirillales bacterium]|nr:ricin-type beta-trefoil lectin domain protein [Rhodospirillales bacterium]
MKKIIAVAFLLLFIVSLSPASNAFAATLADSIPGAKQFEFLEKFVIDHVSTDQDQVTVTGSLHGKPLRFVQTAGKKGISFYVEPVGGRLLMSDFIAEMKDFPGNDAFAIERLIFNERALTMEADVRVSNADLSLVFDVKKIVVGVTSNAVGAHKATLGNVLPSLKDVPVIDALVFEAITFAPKQKSISATGKVKTVEGTLTIDLAKGLDGAVVELAATKGKITPGDVLGELAGVPVVDAFAMEKLTYDRQAETFSGTGLFGKIEGVLSLDVKRGMKNLVADLKPTSAITLADILPDLKGIPVVSAYAFTGVSYAREQKTVSVVGAINNKSVSLDITDDQGMVLDLKAASDIAVGDVISQLRDVPGINAFGIRELTLKGTTITADVAFGKETAKLSIDLSGLKEAGQYLTLNIKPDDANISIARLFPDLAGIPGLKDFSLADLDFTEKTKSLISSIKFGTGSNAKTAKISSSGNKGGARLFKLTSPHLNIGDIVPSLGNIPLFASLKFDELDITKTSIETTLAVGKAAVKLFASLEDGFAALDFGALDAAALIPAAGNTILKDLKLASSIFVVSRTPNATPGNLPADMLKAMGNVDLKRPFKQGINLLGNLRKEDLGPKLSGLFDKLAIKAPSFPISGVFPTEIFGFIKDGAKEAEKEIAGAILDALDLTIDIPLPAIKELEDFATFKTAHLSISGNSGDDPFWGNLPKEMQQKKPTGRLDVSLRGGMTLKLAAFDKNVKSPIELETLIDLNAGDGAKSISLLGRVDGVWDTPLGIKGLAFEKSGFDISYSTGEAGKKVELSFFSAAKLHDKTDLSVDASFSESGGLPKLEYFVLDGPLALTDLAGDLPNASNFIVHEIKLYPNGVEAQVEFKNKLLDERTNLYLFELDTPTGKALVAAIDLAFNAKTKSKQHFSLGKLASVADLKGAKAKTIQTHLDAMAVANAALILSTKKVFPLPPDSLAGGIAGDLFHGIFGDSKVPVKLDNVTFLSDFQANLMGEIGNKLTNGVNGIKIGLSEEAIINGAIGGLFDSDPLSLDLEFLMASSLSLDHLQKSGLKLPKFLKAKPAKMGGAEKIGIFLKVVDVTFEAGLLAGFDVQYNDTAFDFTGTLGIQMAEEEVGLSLSGAMSDTWKDALGIKGFELENVTVSGEVQVEPPSIKIGLGGDANLWGHDMSTAGDLSVGLLGEVPIPEGLGLKTTVSDLDVTMYEILNTTMIASQPVAFAMTPEMWPILLAGVVAEVGLSEAYTVIYDEVNHKKMTPGDLAKAPFKDAMQLIKDYSELQAWMFGGKDIYLSFATPGASDANLGIPDGIHFSGKVELFGGAIKTPSLQPNIGWIYRIAQDIYKAEEKVKGKVVDGGKEAKAFSQEEFKRFKNRIALLRDIIAHEAGIAKKTITVDYVKPSEKEVKDFLDSVSFTQKGSFKLGGLEFSDAHVSLVPFKVTSKTKLFGNEEDVELTLKDGKLVLETKTTIEAIGETDLVLEFDLEKQDFIVVGEYSANSSLQDWLAKEIEAGIKQISSTAGGKLKALDKDLADATKVRDDAEKVLAAAQKAVSQVTQGAVERLQQTTDAYRQDYESANNAYNGCNGWKKYYCQAKWWPRKGLAWDSWKASEQLLADAKLALSEAKSLAVEVHKAEIKANDAATKVALAAKDVAAATDIRDIIAKGLDTFANDARRMAKLFKLDKAFIAGSVKDLLGGKPLVVDLYFELNGKKYEEFFALSPTDASFNALSFGLLPVIAAEHIVEDMESTLEKELGPIGNVAAKLTTWIKAHVYELVGGLRDNLEKKIADIAYELTQEESKYKKIFDSLEGNGGKFLSGYQDLTDQSNQILSTYKLTDFMPASAVFTNRYLAVGHSSLCLGVATNGVDVYQQNCKDTDAERWSAVPLDKAQDGYVLLKSKGLCLQARNADEKSGQPLILAQCSGKDDHEKWKFIAQDGVFSKFVNRFSQKCLHFDTVNANAKTGYSVWTSCFGADSQGFRVLNDAEKPSFYKVEKMIKARNGGCLVVDPDFNKYFFKTAKGQSTSSRDQLLNMQQMKDNALYSGSCAADDTSLFNYVEAVDGDLKLIHARSGWCVVPGPRRDGALALMPCDHGKDMYWKVREAGDTAFALRNNQTGTCLDLGSSAKGPANARFAVVANCQSRPEQVLEFVKN